MDTYGRNWWGRFVERVLLRRWLSRFAKSISRFAKSIIDRAQEDGVISNERCHALDARIDKRLGRKWAR